MGDPVDQRTAADTQAALLLLRPIHGPKAERWTVQMEDNILSLLSSDGRLVMMLPQEDAARHVHFEQDLVFGWTVSFVVEGLRSHRFRCGPRDLARLLRWLPQRPQHELEREVRHYGIALILVGTVQVLFQEVFFWAWGLLFILAGIANIFIPRRFMHALNAVLMLAVGLGLLFYSRHTPPPSNMVREVIGVLPTGLGSLLLIWSIQQFSLLGPNHQIRVVRGRNMAADAEWNQTSPAIRKVSWGVTALAGLFVCQFAGLFAQVWIGEEQPTGTDWLLCVILLAVCLGAVAVLRLRRTSAYLEAQVAGQFAVVLGVLYVAGLFVLPLEGRLPFSPEVLWLGLFAMGTPYVWIPLVVLVVLFNRWFNRAVQKELEQNNE